MTEEYISKEAAIRKLRGEAIAKYPLSFVNGLLAGADELKSIPAADAVAVVRCRECIYWRGENDLCKGICIDFGADGYCSEGKRKDGGTDDANN